MSKKIKNIGEALYIINKHAKEIREKRNAIKAFLYPRSRYLYPFDEKYTIRYWAIYSEFYDMEDLAEEYRECQCYLEDPFIYWYYVFDEETLEEIKARDDDDEEKQEFIQEAIEYVEEVTDRYYEAQHLHHELRRLKEEQKDAYELKDRCIDLIIDRNELEPIAYHNINGETWALYNIDGFKFHSLNFYKNDDIEITSTITDPISSECKLDIDYEAAVEYARHYMWAMNNVQLIGRLTRDVEITSDPGGIKVAKFALAVDKGLSKDKRAEYEAQGKPFPDFITTPDFIKCLKYGHKQIETLHKHAGKGDRIGVVGQMVPGKYEDHNGKMVYTPIILVKDFDIIDFKDNEKEIGIEK